MKKSRIAFVLTLAPAILAAQSATATTTTSAEAAAKAGRAQAAANAQATTATSAQADIPQSYSAESRAKLNATFNAARERKLPEQPIRDRVAEGQAKGASETQVVVAAQRAEARLEAAQSAMIRAGRQPNDGELIRAERAMARGATEAQVEAVARSTPPERSIAVELDAIALTSGTNANASAGATVATPKVGASTAVTGGVGAGTSGAATTVTGAATAGVGAVIRKPPV